MIKVDFLSSKFSPKIKKRPRIRKKLKIFLIVLALFVIGLTAFVNVQMEPIITTYFKTLGGKEDIKIAQKALQEQKLRIASLALESAFQNLSEAQKALDKLKWLEGIPYLNLQIKAARYLLSTSTQISSALKGTTQAMQNIMEPLGKASNLIGISSEQKAEILKKLRQATPSFERALSEVELAELELGKVPQKGLIKKLEEQRKFTLDNLPKVKQALSQAIVMSRLLPGITGYPEKQTYLFLFQNNTELRPSGGFWGSYGVLKVKNGEIEEFWTDNTYNLDRASDIQVEPPWQIPKLISPITKSWYLRDANWSPDFVISAKKAEWFYKEEGGKEEKLDGVIACTPTLLESILEILGDIQLPDYHYTFTSKDFTEKLQYFVEMKYSELGIEEPQRKDILGDLSKKLFDKVLLLPKEKWLDFINTLQKNLNEKHILIYTHDQETQKFISQKNWDGEVKKTDGDYLLAVDSNMASLKTDAYVDRNITYLLEINEQGQAKVKVSLNYKNNAPGFSWRYTRYRTWTRIYVPKGSQLLAISGNEKDPQFYEPDTPYEIYEELGKTVFGTFLVIEPGQEKALVFEYTLPDKVTSDLKEKGYKLLVQKQPGVIKPGLNINLAFPNKIISYTPFEIGQVVNESKIEFKIDLLVDREFQVHF